MHVGICQVRFRMPDNFSLKDKRQIVKSVIARVRNKFDVAIAEVADNDNWDLATLGISCISTSHGHANEILSNVVDFINGLNLDAELLGYEIEIMPVFEMA